MSKYDVELPDDLKPSQEMIEASKEIDKRYVTLYNALMDNDKHGEDEGSKLSSTEAIYIISQFITEKVALMIGEDIGDYDKGLLRNIIERHVASIVFVE